MDSSVGDDIYPWSHNKKIQLWTIMRIEMCQHYIIDIFDPVPGRFAPIPVCPGSFRPHLFIVL